ncbi:hypothetical protein DFH09DRAFT_1136961 [Mycena vulgaris]|nr:hypothetical protein DFH09DRAFT_1136961 [Mycena vulgaris]
MTPNDRDLPAVLALPTELLWSILRLATPPAIELGHAESPPFSQKPGATPHADMTLRDKLSVVLVCRCWQAVATEFLYEDLVLANFVGVRHLLELFETTSAEDPSAGYGRYVHSIWTRSPVDLAYFRVIDFFPFCPNLRILSKGDAQTGDTGFWSIRSDHGTDHNLQSAFLSLRALFWGEGTAFSRPENFQYSVLLDFLILCPNIEFLSIPSTPQSFVYLRQAMEDNPAAGKNIKYLELQPVVRTWILPFQHLLDFFPSLREFSHHVGRPRIPMTQKNSSVICVRLCVSRLLPPSENTLRAATPELTELAGPGFSSLQRVVLHGDWSSVVNIPAFRAIEQNLRDSGRRLVFADGEPAQRANRG